MTVKKMTALGLIVVIVSFLGFCVENIWLAATKGYMDNRNMRLPFLLGYGLAVLAIYAMFGLPQQPRLFGYVLPVESKTLRILCYYLICCLCVAVGEIALGTFVEKTCGSIWWDYSRLPLHITRYTSIPTTLAFGALITVFMGCFFMPLYRGFSGMQGSAWGIAACLMLTLLVADFARSASGMFHEGQLSQVWRVDVSQNPVYQFLIAQRPGL